MLQVRSPCCILDCDSSSAAEAAILCCMKQAYRIDAGTSFCGQGLFALANHQAGVRPWNDHGIKHPPFLHGCEVTRHYVVVSVGCPSLACHADQGHQHDRRFCYRFKQFKNPKALPTTHLPCFIVTSESLRPHCSHQGDLKCGPCI